MIQPSKENEYSESEDKKIDLGLSLAKLIQKVQQEKVKSVVIKNESIFQASQSARRESKDKEIFQDSFLMEMHSNAMKNRETLLLERYQLLEELGAGGMGKIYLATDRNLNRMVAIKLLKRISEHQRKRMKYEAQLLARLSHSNIVKVYDYQPIETGEDILVMEYLQGWSLSQYIAETDMGSDIIWNILQQIAEGMSCAHKSGIIHRDLKPANIFVENTGRVVVLDFGLAKDLHHEMGLTHTGVPVGTFRYMSPEQINRGKVSPASDVWGIGCILYEMLTRKTAIEGEVEANVIYNICRGQIVLPRERNPQADPILEQICIKALNKDIQERYSNAQMMLEEIKQLQYTSNQIIRQNRIKRRERRSIKKSRNPNIVLLFFVFFIFVGIVFYFFIPNQTKNKQTPLEEDRVKTKPEAIQKISLPQKIKLLDKENSPVFAFFTGKNINDRKGRIAFMNWDKIPVRIRIFHPDQKQKTPSIIYQISPETNEYVSSENYGSHWGIQMDDSFIYNVDAISDWNFFEGNYIFQTSNNRFTLPPAMRNGKLAFNNGQHQPTTVRLYRPDRSRDAAITISIPGGTNLWVGETSYDDHYGIQMDDSPIFKLGHICEWNFWNNEYLFQCDTGFILKYQSKVFSEEEIWINFDSVDASKKNIEANSYLSNFGITLSEITPSSSIYIVNRNNVYEGKQIIATSVPNMLTQLGSNKAVAFTMNFSRPVSTLSFSRPRILAGPSKIAHPVWQAQAMDKQQKKLDQTGEETISSSVDILAKTFWLRGPGVTSVRFTSESDGVTAFPALFLDDLILRIRK